MVLALLFLLPACTAEEATDQVLVAAAASLTDAFRDIERAFEDTYPETDLILNLGGSSALREQILEGAPLDVFASADIANMRRVVLAGEVAGEPRVFASNQLQIAVPEGNPAGVEALEEFADEELVLGLCAPAVPCGEFARQALDRAGVVASADTNEPDVRALLTKVEAGELDAGIVYATDVAGSEEVEGIEIPLRYNPVADYPIATLANAPNPDGAVAFVEFVFSEEAQAILADHGFQVP